MSWSVDQRRIFCSFFSIKLKNASLVKSPPRVTNSDYLQICTSQEIVDVVPFIPVVPDV